MIIVVIHKANGAFWIDGPYEDWCEAQKESDRWEKLPNTNAYVVRLYKRNEHGAPMYPFPTGDYDDEC